MRHLFLVRHAKSDQGLDQLPDIDRPLSTRGYRDAPAMGQQLKKRQVQPDLLLTSPAVRAISTALIFARELGYPASKLVIEPRIYEASPATLLAVIGEQTAQSLMLFGHNPTFSEVATELSGVSFDELPTAAVVCIRFAASAWSKAVIERGELELFDYPKNHN